MNRRQQTGVIPILCPRFGSLEDSDRRRLPDVPSPTTRDSTERVNLFVREPSRSAVAVSINVGQLDRSAISPEAVRTRPAGAGISGLRG